MECINDHKQPTFDKHYTQIPTRKGSQDAQNLPTVYVGQQKWGVGKMKFTFVFPLSLFLLLRVRQRLQKHFNHLYGLQQDADSVKYFIQLQQITTQTNREKLVNLVNYQLHQYSQFNKQEVEQQRRYEELPTYLWVTEKQNSNYSNWLRERQIQFAYADNHYLIELALHNQEAVRDYFEKRRSKIEKTVQISTFLILRFNNKLRGVVRQLEFIERLNERYKIQLVDLGAQKVFLFETKHIFETLSLRDKLKRQKMDAQFISEERFEALRKVVLKDRESQGLNLQGIERQAKDVFYLQAALNNSQNDLLRRLQFAADNWEMFQPFQERKLQTFQDKLIYYKESQKIEYQTIIPKVKRVSQKVSKANEYKGGKQGGRWPRENCLLEAFARAAQQQEYDNCLIQQQDQKMQLGEGIAQFIESLPEHKVGRAVNLFNRVAHCHTISQGRPLSKEELSWQVIQNSGCQIQKSPKCLGCQPFFQYKGNIYDDQSVTNCKPLLLGPVSLLRESSNDFKEKARELMVSVGGVILFDCYADYFQVKPIGCYLTHEQRQQIRNNIQTIFEMLLNQDKESELIPKGIEVSFVPVTKNVRKNQNAEKHQIKDLFVTRVIIKLEIKGGQSLKDRKKSFLWSRASCFHQGLCNQPMEFPEQRQWVSRRSKRQEQAKKYNEQLLRFPHLSLIAVGQLKKYQVQKLLRECGCLESEFKLVQWLQRERKNNGQSKDLLRLKEFMKSMFLLHHATPLGQLKPLLDHAINKKNKANHQRVPSVWLKMQKVESFIMVHEIDRVKRHYNDFLKLYQEQYSDQILLWEFYVDDRTEHYVSVADQYQIIFVYTLLKFHNLSPSFQRPRGFGGFTHKDIHQKLRLLKPNKSQEGEVHLKNWLFERSRERR